MTRNLVTAAGQGNLIVRHLLLPGHFDCCFRPIVCWMKHNLADAKFSIRDGYLPSWQSDRHTELARPLEPGAGDRARDHAILCRIEGYRMKFVKTNRPAEIDESAESEITIHPDGRVFAFGITKSLATVLRTIPMADNDVKRLLERIGNLDSEANEPIRPHCQGDRVMPEPVGMNGHRLPATPEGRREAHMPAKPAPAAPPAKSCS